MNTIDLDRALQLFSLFQIIIYLTFLLLILFKKFCKILYIFIMTCLINNFSHELDKWANFAEFF